MALPENPTAPRPAKMRPRRRLCAKLSVVGDNALTRPILRTRRRAVFVLSSFAQSEQLALRAIDVRFAFVFHAFIILPREFFDLGSRYRGSAKEALKQIAPHQTRYPVENQPFHDRGDLLQPEST